MVKWLTKDLLEILKTFQGTKEYCFPVLWVRFTTPEDQMSEKLRKISIVNEMKFLNWKEECDT